MESLNVESDAVCTHKVAGETLGRVARTDRCDRSTARDTRGGDRSTARENTDGGDEKHSQREQTAVIRAQPREHVSEVRETRVRAIRKRNNKIDKYNNYLSNYE